MKEGEERKTETLPHRETTTVGKPRGASNKEETINYDSSQRATTSLREPQIRMSQKRTK